MQSEPQFVAAWGLPGGMEWLVIMVIALLIFGRRLPEVMRGLGSGVRQFKKGMDTDLEPSAQPVKPIDGVVSRGSDHPALPNDHHNPPKA